MLVKVTGAHPSLVTYQLGANTSRENKMHENNSSTHSAGWALQNKLIVYTGIACCENNPH